MADTLSETAKRYFKVTIRAGVIVSYRVIIGLSRENRLSKYAMLLRNLVYTVVEH